MVRLSNLAVLGATIGISLAQLGKNVEIDHRSLDEIYEAAQKESGPLIVASGGDSMFAPHLEI
jgi:hypothetical protein